MADEDTAEYPAEYEAEGVLRDGSRVLLRPIRKDDTGVWLAFLSRLSTHSRYLRFHHVPKQMTQEDAVRFCTVDYTNTFAFVAEVAKAQCREIVAVARYYRLGDHSAEVAFAIEDAYQGKGLGTKLLEALASVARDNDITVFEANVLAENCQMMSVFMDCFPVTSELDVDVYHLSFPITQAAKMVQQED